MIIRKKPVYAFYFILLMLPFFQLGELVGQRYYPALVSGVTLVFFTFLSALSGPIKVFNNSILLMLYAYSLAILSSLFGSDNLNELIFNFVKTILPVILFCYYFAFFRHIEYLKALRIINFYIVLVIFIGVIELILRSYAFLTDGSILQTVSSNFYILKMDSPFFADSNATALFLLFSLCLVVCTPRLKSKNIYMFLLLILIFFTFSRAAIITSFLVILLSFFTKKISISKLILIMIIIFASVLSLPFIFETVLLDGSGVTKITVFNLVPKIFLNDLSNLQRLFGEGINEGSLIYGYEDGKFSHALIPMILGQVGLVGLIGYMLFFFFGMLYSARSSLIFFFALFLVGLSYVHPFYEYIFLTFGIILGISKNKNVNEKRAY